MVLCHCLLGSVYFGACTLSWDGNSRPATPPEAWAQTGTANAQSTNTVCELVSALCGCGFAWVCPHCVGVGLRGCVHTVCVGLRGCVRTVWVWVCVGVSALCGCGFAWVCPHCVGVGLWGGVRTVWGGLRGCVRTVWVWVCMGVSTLYVWGFAWVCPHYVCVGVSALCGCGFACVYFHVQLLQCSVPIDTS